MPALEARLLLERLERELVRLLRLLPRMLLLERLELRPEDLLFELPLELLLPLLPREQDLDPLCCSFACHQPFQASASTRSGRQAYNRSCRRRSFRESDYLAFVGDCSFALWTP